MQLFWVWPSKASASYFAVSTRGVHACAQSLLFLGYGDSQNIGYIVPSNVIKQFLRDVEVNGNYTGFVTLGVTYQTLENPTMKSFFGLDSLDVSQLPKGITPTGKF